MQQMLVQSLGWEDPLEKEMVSLPGESHKQRSRAEKETNMTWCLNNNINKVYNSVALSILILPCNHSHHPSPELFHLPKRKLYTSKKHVPFLPFLSAWHLPSTSCLNKCDYSRTSPSAIKAVFVLCAWLISLSTVSSGFIHVLTSVRTSFLFKVNISFDIISFADKGPYNQSYGFFQ